VLGKTSLSPPIIERGGRKPRETKEKSKKYNK
jgi:hypothetical protein